MKTIPLLAACALAVTLVSPAWAEPDSSPSVSLEGIYWRPAGLDFPVIQPTSGGNLGTGSSSGISYDFAPGYRLAIQWENIRVKWTDLQTQTNFSASCPSGDCSAAQRGATANTLNSASAWSTMRLQMLDLDFLKPLGTDPEPAFTASFGLRYARIYNGTDIFYSAANSTTDDLQSRIVNNMIGLRTGIEGHYQIRSKFRLIGSAAVSLLDGNSHSDASNTNSGGSSVGQTGITYNKPTSVLEMGLKLNYTPVKDCDIWVGYDFLQFTDGLVGQTFPVGNTTFTSQEVNQTISFMGPSAGLRWRF